MKHLFRLGAAVAALLAATTLADAQQAGPQRTTATFEDWTVRCETHEGRAKVCEMFQSVHIKGQPNPISQVAIGRPKKGEPFKAVFQVPINVWLPTGVRLSYDKKDDGIAAVYKRCLPAACFADIEIKDDTLKKLRAHSDQGHLHFKDAAQRDISIPVSFKGFAQAFDALNKE